MARRVKIWFDREADFLEVTFNDEPGYMRPTDDDAVMQRVNDAGQVIGFSIMNVSHLPDDHPISTELSDA